MISLFHITARAARRAIMRIGCMFRGHHYYPSYHHFYVQKAWYLAKEDERFVYECADCDTPVSVHGREAHKAFILKHNPSWGGRGSDSQGNLQSDDKKSQGE